MAGYNSQVSRDDAAALIPEEASREILMAVPQQSSVMQLARKLPDMSRKQYRIPVVSALAEAYFVTGDTGLKQTSEQNWTNKYVYAEELAVIVPIPQTVVDDVDYDMWSAIKPSIAEAFGKAFDLAVLHGTNAPDAWPDDLVTGATAAGHTVSLAAKADIFDAVLGDTGTMSLFEADGYDANGHVAALSVKSKLRGLRSSTGEPIFLQNMIQDKVLYALDGQPLVFPKNGGITPSAALMFSGDWSQLVWSMRQDITYKILTEGVIQGADGAIVYNLAQQDMIAIRAVMRLGWALPNPVNRVNATEATRYPFAILLP